jgi:hypothetical protein
VIETVMEKQNNCVIRKPDGEGVSSDTHVTDRVVGQEVCQAEARKNSISRNRQDMGETRENA